MTTIDLTEYQNVGAYIEDGVAVFDAGDDESGVTIEVRVPLDRVAYLARENGYYGHRQRAREQAQS